MDDMGIVVGGETTVELAAGSHVGEEVTGCLVAVVQLDDGLAQVHLLTVRPTDILSMQVT